MGTEQANRATEQKQASVLNLLFFPIKKLRSRFLRPLLNRQQNTEDRLGIIEQQLHCLREQVGQLHQRLTVVEAMGWDHVALVKRLSSIEDKLMNHCTDQYDLQTQHTEVDDREMSF